MVHQCIGFAYRTGQRIGMRLGKGISAKNSLAIRRCSRIRSNRLTLTSQQTRLTQAVANLLLNLNSSEDNLAIGWDIGIEDSDDDGG